MQTLMPNYVHPTEPGGSSPELMVEVLETLNLSKAGELFQMSDDKVMLTLLQVVPRIISIINEESYTDSTNNQSVVEICIQRITTALQ